MTNITSSERFNVTCQRLIEILSESSIDIERFERTISDPERVARLIDVISKTKTSREADSINELGRFISINAVSILRTLKRNGITTISQVAGMSHKELVCLDGIGDHTAKCIQQALAIGFNISFECAS